MSAVSFGRPRRIARTRPTASNVIFIFVQCLQHGRLAAATVVAVAMLPM